MTDTFSINLPFFNTSQMTNTHSKIICSVLFCLAPLQYLVVSYLAYSICAEYSIGNPKFIYINYGKKRGLLNVKNNILKIDYF